MLSQLWQSIKKSYIKLNTPYHEWTINTAAVAGHLDIMKTLVEYKLDYPDEKTMFYVMKIENEKEKKEIAKYLLELNCQINYSILTDSEMHYLLMLGLKENVSESTII